jgi:hypothetical protein
METSRTKTKTSFIFRGMDGEEEGCERAKGKANTHHQEQTASALALRIKWGRRLIHSPPVVRMHAHTTQDVDKPPANKPTRKTHRLGHSNRFANMERAVMTEAPNGLERKVMIQIMTQSTSFISR